MAKLIKLTQGKFATVDEEDFESLNQKKWCASVNRKGGDYAALCYENGKMIRMHRKILGVTDSKIMVDHIDHDTLNNQRYNLRLATITQNNFNRKSLPNSTSKYRGVSWYSRDKRWVARIGNGGTQKTLGWFRDEIEAALAYNKAAIERYGEFANLNKI